MLARYQNNQAQFHVVEDGVTYYVEEGQKKYYYSAKKAERWIEFIEHYCRHSIGKWRGKLIELAEWQKWIIREFFGWLCCDTGFRRYKYLYLFVPRKNGKTLLMACLALGLLLIDKEEAPEIYCIASKDDQAHKLFDATAFMCNYEPEGELDNPLKEKTRVLSDIITAPKSGGKIIPLPFSPDGFHGENPSTIFLDELHVHPNDGMKRVGETGMGTRDQPNVIMITTAGQRVGTFDHDELKLARTIRDGVIIADNYLACIFEPEEDWAWDDIETAKKVNPMFGISLNEKFFRDEIANAKRKPKDMLEYKQLQLNMYTQSAKCWMPHDIWIKGRKKFDFRDFRSEPIYWGLDLASIRDLSALVLLRRPPDGVDDYWYAHAHFWCPEAVVEENRGTFKNYEYWKKRGYLVATPGNSTDYGFIRKQINDYGKMFDLNIGHADPHNATHLLNQLRDDDGINVEFMRQGYISMNEPVKTLMGLVLNGQLIHNNPILDWMSSNAITTSDAARNLKFDKVKDDEKIDGILALAMAVGAALRRPESEGVNVCAA